MSNTINDVGSTRVLDTSKPREVSNDLGKDSFLNLLVTQMSNQDPLEPTSDTEFISQMANFSTLEQMQNMSKELAAQTTNGLIGQNITANKIADGEGVITHKDVYGRVFGVTNIGDNQYLNVYDIEADCEYLVPVSAVQQVTDGSGDMLQTLLGEILSQLQGMNSNLAYNSEAAAAAYQNALLPED